MTFPNRYGRASHTSSADETFRAVMPATVAKHDTLYVAYAGDGTGATLLDASGDFVGWNRRSYRTAAGMHAGVLYKIADGTEGGQTLIAGTSPSEKWCVESYVISDAQFGNHGSRTEEVTGANPDPAGFASPVALADRLWLLFVAGDGSGAFSGGPSNMSLVSRLNNGAADGVALDCHEVLAAVTNLDPTALTRASALWMSNLIHIRSQQDVAPLAPWIEDQKAEVLSGTVKDFTVTISTGPDRRFFACIQNSASAGITSVVLDPGGLAIALSVATDGSTTAESVAGTAGPLVWYTFDPANMPPAGGYTLRVTTGASVTNACISFCLTNAEQSLNVTDVSNGSGSTSASATGTLTVLDHGLVLLVAAQSRTAPWEVFPWDTRTVDGTTMQSRLTAWPSPDYVTGFAHFVDTGGNLAVEVDAASGVAEVYSAISIGYANSYNAPHFGTI